MCIRDRALATANVGIAMGAGGTDVALETADVVLMSSNLAMLPFALQLSRRANRIIRQNVIFSMSVIVTLVISTILLPILYDGFLLPLPMGVVGHEGSTLIVVANGPVSYTHLDVYKRQRPEWRTLGFWKENYEFVLAIVTLLALLIGWIGGEVTGALPGWAVTTRCV